MKPDVRCTPALLVLLLATAPALAQPAGPTAKERVVGILEVRGPTPEVEAAFEKSLEEQLDTTQYWLAPRKKMRERLNNSTKWTAGCVVGDCLAEVKVQTNAEIVILAALEGSGTTFGFVVTLVRTDNGRVLLQEAERCDVCTLNEAMTAATLATIKLLNAVPDKLPDETAQYRLERELAVDAVERKRTAAARRHKRIGVTLTITGLVIAAAGGALYALKSDDDLGEYALIGGAAGAGLAAGGLLSIAF